MSKITYIQARQILDSRGNPTVEADVFLEDGSMGRASVPSGASTGTHEAHELRDGEKAYHGKGVLQAVENIEGEIATALIGADFTYQSELDSLLIELDGTENKERLGANALLSVSLAMAKAEANTREQFLFEYIHTLSRIVRTPVLPIPMCNVINGGMHATHSTDIQEFMIVPVGAQTFSDALQMVTETFYKLRAILSDTGHSTTVGDEGGFAPKLTKGNREAFELLLQAIEQAGYVPGQDISLAIDVAASSFFDGKQYILKSEDRVLSKEDMIDFYTSLVKDFPLISIEDGLEEGDWEGWKTLTERLGEKTQLVGDDLLVTNVSFLKKGIKERAANAILVKVNQIGTLTEAIDAVDTAHEAGWNAIVSHRSGETEDTTIAHLAVGLMTGQIKTGSLSRTDRIAKYNELLRIEETLGERAIYGTGRE